MVNLEFIEGIDTIVGDSSIIIADFVNGKGITNKLFYANNFCNELLDKPVIKYFTYDSTQAGIARFNVSVGNSINISDSVMQRFNEKEHFVDNDIAELFSFSDIKNLESQYRKEINRLKPSKYYNPFSDVYKDNPSEKWNMIFLGSTLISGTVVAICGVPLAMIGTPAVVLGVEYFRFNASCCNKRMLESIEEPLEHYDTFQKNLNKASKTSVEVTHFPEAEMEVAKALAASKNASGSYLGIDYGALNGAIMNSYCLESKLLLEK
jgi:hypothetical protein